MNPIIALILNTTAKTYHPIVFVESPLPGPDSPDKPVRHKSKMHHTGGFATREQAVNDANAFVPRLKGAFLGEPKLALTRDFEWDGNGIPAIVAFFADSPAGLVAAL